VLTCLQSSYADALPSLGLHRLEEADALLLIEAPCENVMFFPSKIVDYFEVGRPVLALSRKGGVVEALFWTCSFGEFAPVE
jgi:hypothetical protein